VYVGTALTFSLSGGSRCDRVPVRRDGGDALGDRR
jgi:hypothetical protein